MNRAKVTASILVIICVIGPLSFFALLPQNQPENIPKLKSYITSETQVKQSLVVWQLQGLLTIVNDTTTTYLNFYNWTYNQTSQMASSELVDSWQINYITDIVYNSTNSADAIQWAIDHTTGVIELTPNTYQITNQTLRIEQSVSVNGNNALLNCSGNMRYAVFIDTWEPVTIQGLQICMNGITNGVWVSPKESSPYYQSLQNDVIESDLLNCVDKKEVPK